MIRYFHSQRKRVNARGLIFLIFELCQHPILTLSTGKKFKATLDEGVGDWGLYHDYAKNTVRLQCMSLPQCTYSNYFRLEFRK